jgi:hypothetical protein
MEEAGLKLLESGEVNCPSSYPDFETFWRGHIAGGNSQAAARIIGTEKLKATMQEAVKAFQTDDGRIEIAPNIFRYVVASV